MSNQTTPEQTVIETKAKLFDAIEANQSLAAQVKELSGALQAVAEVVGIVPDENGTVQLGAIVEAVKLLVPTEQIEVDAE